jgi:hypothetical protein
MSTDPTPIPAEAVDAAAREIATWYGGVMFQVIQPDQARFLARLAVIAAAPILRAEGAAAGRTAAAPTSDDPWKNWGRPEPADLDAIENFWLSDCPEHDIGEPERGCNCPQGDYRQVISDLVDEVRALRNDVAGGEDRGRTAAAADIRANAAEWDSAKNTGAYSKGLHAAARIAERGAARVAENGADR